jgi:uncharacterized RDD family membrane protein YckC
MGSHATMAYQQATQSYSAPRAGFWRRFGGMLIDGIVVGIVPWILILMSGDSAVQVLGLALLLLGTIVYYTVLEGGPGGQTLGKKAVGIRVTDIATGGPIGYGRALARTVFRPVSWLFGFFPLGYLWMLWDKQKQTWHDNVARSVVVPATQTVPQAPPSWPANWYPDPLGERRLRYWDGGQWTGHTAD